MKKTSKTPKLPAAKATAVAATVNPVNPVNPVQKLYESAQLVACLDRSAKLTNEFFLELAAFKPGIAFFRDDAFNDDAARINVEQIFKQNSPNTTVKVI